MPISPCRRQRLNQSTYSRVATRGRPTTPRAVLRLVQAVEGFGPRVVVAVAPRTNGSDHTGLGEVLQVSRTAYYQWTIELLSARARARIMLSERIAAIHARSRQTHGAPRLHAELHICGERHGRKRVARLMRRAGLAGRVHKRYSRTTIGDPLTVLPDLMQRDFTPTHPDQLWVGDITHIRTWEGWLYLATVLDCFSRRVVGWAIADHLRTELPLRALHMALARRNPTDTLIHPTDLG
jgi:transposase InsO family protein